MLRTRLSCCARANTGHATALPSPAMKSRRSIVISRADGGAYPGVGRWGTGSTPDTRRLGFEIPAYRRALMPLCYPVRPNGAATGRL